MLFPLGFHPSFFRVDQAQREYVGVAVLDFGAFRQHARPYTNFLPSSGNNVQLLLRGSDGRAIAGVSRDAKLGVNCKLQDKYVQ